MQNTIDTSPHGNDGASGCRNDPAASRDVVYAKGAYRRFLLLDRKQQTRVRALVMGCAAGPNGHELSGGMFSIEALPGLRVVLASNGRCLTVLAFTGEASR